MAVYSTFFVAMPEELLSGFPGWKLPLQNPVKRDLTDFFGQKLTIETCEPEWEDVLRDEEPEQGVVAVEGDYLAYLEARLPVFVREALHWCCKSLTDVEINPLGELIDGKPALEEGLFAHPSRNAHIMVMRPLIVHELLKAPLQLAPKWAELMSSPGYTQSADKSDRVQKGWSVEDALSILDPLGELARKSQPGQRLYLLLEW